MRYPSSFVLMSADTEADLLRHHGSSSMATGTMGVGLTGPSTPTPATGGIPLNNPTTQSAPLLGDSPLKTLPLLRMAGAAASLEPGMDPSLSSTIGSRVCEKALQDGSLTTGIYLQRWVYSDTHAV